MTLHFRDWRGATSLRYRNGAEITVRMYETEALISGTALVPAQKLSGIYIVHMAGLNLVQILPAVCVMP